MTGWRVSAVEDSFSVLSVVAAPALGSSDLEPAQSLVDGPGPGRVPDEGLDQHGPRSVAPNPRSGDAGRGWGCGSMAGSGSAGCRPRGGGSFRAGPGPSDARCRARRVFRRLCKSRAWQRAGRCSRGRRSASGHRPGWCSRGRVVTGDELGPPSALPGGAQDDTQVERSNFGENGRSPGRRGRRLVVPLSGLGQGDPAVPVHGASMVTLATATSPLRGQEY